MPPWWFLLVLLGAAVALAFLFGYFGHRPPADNLYDCQRCGHHFSAPSGEGYPARCPACNAADWAV